MKSFVYETILESINICNLTDDRKKLVDEIIRGNRIVFYGRRNTGKTSLIKSLVIPDFNQQYKRPLTIFVDLMGVKNIESIGQRIRYGVEQSLASIGTAQKIALEIGKIIKRARPSISLDSITGAPTISLGLSSEDEKSNLYDIFSFISDYHKKHNALIVMDEFQDIINVAEADSIFRDLLQNLPSNLPVIILGSKKHLLSNLFANPSAPLAGWGKFIEISSISATHYFKYIQERFNNYNLSITIEVVKHIQEMLDNIPEAINIVCDQILRDLACNKNINVQENDINMAIRKTIENRAGLFEERFLRFSSKERKFLEQVAKNGPILNPNGKNFLKKVNLSSGGSGPLIKRLEADAIIYKTKKGYVVSDPLLTNYLRIKY